MNAVLKSEFRKLLTVRSTYVVTALACLFTLFMAFFIEGYRGLSMPPGGYGPNKLTELVFNTPFVAAQLGVIVAILQMIHEYRHNTITYTLTAANSRLKVLGAKIISVTAYTVFLAILVAVMAIIGFYAGTTLKGSPVPVQHFDVWNVFARCIFYASGFTLLGLAIAALVRNVALAIVIMFMVPGTVETLLGLLLKQNAAYLPFTLLSKLVIITPTEGVPITKDISPIRAALIYSVYLLVIWLITAWTFQRRDAN